MFFISLIVGLRKIRKYYALKLGKVKQEQKGDMSNVYYTAYFVDNPAELLRQFSPKHKHVYAHHSTNAYKPESLEGVVVGEKVKLKILGRVYDEKCDALIVENSKSKNSHPHITLSCADGIPPVCSNTLLEHATLEQKELFSEPIYVDVTEGYVVKNEDVILP